MRAGAGELSEKMRHRRIQAQASCSRPSTSTYKDAKLTIHPRVRRLALWRRSRASGRNCSRPRRPYAVQCVLVCRCVEVSECRPSRSLRASNARNLATHSVPARTETGRTTRGQSGVTRVYASSPFIVKWSTGARPSSLVTFRSQHYVRASRHASSEQCEQSGQSEH